MQITNRDNTHFTSKIKIITSNAFWKQASKIPYEQSNFSNLTAEGIFRGDKGMTYDIRTCSAGGILVKNPHKSKNKFDVILFHLCPPEEDCPKNNNIEYIYAKFDHLIGDSKPVKAFIVGSKMSKELLYSVSFFNKIQKYFKLRNIPYSKFQGSKEYDYIHLAYLGEKDEWLVHSRFIGGRRDPKLVNLFDKMKVLPEDVVNISKRLNITYD